ncbi:MAG: putative periplasmic protein kinase ArgK and related GTPases of G3E family [uncultured Truepera sp.]|uniref:Putative periplasmic protein kinase ArgK and related GTPases of G3E family n=1 Tax=uncultured Truepera sp. TaxID=543023 RepID=A0A6J4V0E9_9DEIN|nr:MAG: putative periplasmic protein kinase ArgK and related GTPases of G3E family [uncultured Truepera sp.]
MIDSLESRFTSGQERALARGISLLEAGDAAGQRLLKAVRALGGHAHIVGITGGPGSGKSTLTDGLIAVARAQGKRVAVLAVDPTSPYSGGAILGDRIRMMRHHADADVFIRSLATRGQLGGLAAATLQAAALLDAYGFDLVFIETVGVGQSEVDIVRVADTTLLVLTPGQGDGVQAFKAGIMEIADVFVVNKADQPGSGRLKREIKAALELAPQPEGWRPPVQETVASEGQGVPELLDTLAAHRAYLEKLGELSRLRGERARFEVSALLAERVRGRLEALESRLVDAVLSGDASAAEVVDTLLGERPVGA